MKTEVYGKFERGLLINAKRQLSEGKKLSALVLAMNLLESHLQNFSLQNEMSIMREVGGVTHPYTSVQINSRVYKKGLYERKTNKSIFTWLEIQQKASDDGIDSISEEQINKLIDGIILFTITYPTEPAE
ncbi:hypothetical protein [Desulfotalea psychrophila]|uniref:hypothetical protein n=1 Tax=Desulfotalea psychrophila TaxID=84980 RepID=UPI00059DED4A|nr:hypothetical protein [Desulfotalea psychrophila]